MRNVVKLLPKRGDLRIVYLFPPFHQPGLEYIRMGDEGDLGFGKAEKPRQLLPGRFRMRDQMIQNIIVDDLQLLQLLPRPFFAEDKFCHVKVLDQNGLDAEHSMLSIQC